MSEEEKSEQPLERPKERTLPPWIENVFVRLRRLSATHHIRVWLLLIGSVVLFLTVVFIALPSATIRVWPRVRLVSHTANVVLVGSGVTLEQGSRSRLPLVPVTVRVERSLTFDDISKNFTGENAELTMTIINETNEDYSLRKGTRLANQAGMIFRIQESVTIDAATILEPGTISVQALADPEDLYGEIVGARGNVPEGLRWDVVNLSVDERKKVFARNTTPGRGGITQFGTLLQEGDLELAEAQLQQELLRAAQTRVEEELELLKVQQGGHYVLFSGRKYDVLTNLLYEGIRLPRALVGQPVSSVPVEGVLTYTMLAYDKDALVNLLKRGLRDHVEKGYELIEHDSERDQVSVHVIAYDDDLKWVKITADLTSKQHAVLSPTSGLGRVFAEKVREAVLGKSVEDAERIVQNLPEVERSDISVWPPWQQSMPSIPNHIVIRAEE